MPDHRFVAFKTFFEMSLICGSHSKERDLNGAVHQSFMFLRFQFDHFLRSHDLLVAITRSNLVKLDKSCHPLKEKETTLYNNCFD